MQRSSPREVVQEKQSAVAHDVIQSSVNERDSLTCRPLKRWEPKANICTAAATTQSEQNQRHQVDRLWLMPDIAAFAPRHCLWVALGRSARQLRAQEWFTTCISCLARLDHLRHGPAGTARVVAGDQVRLLHDSTAARHARSRPILFCTPCAQNQMRMMNIGTGRQPSLNDGALP